MSPEYGPLNHRCHSRLLLDDIDGVFTFDDDNAQVWRLRE